MRVLIVRPFGTKEGIDFERVERELIQPALGRLRERGVPVEGGTTGEITRSGNIREDMFRLLVISDLVIADVSIHNANVFYELGIRHALRRRATFVIRSKTLHEYPFDLQTDRYFLYDAAAPEGTNGKAVEALADALRSTLDVAPVDSPMFRLLPKLKPHDRGQLVTVPIDFIEEVEVAVRDRQRGKLRLLAHEVQSLEWDHEGLRMVGDAQFKLRANPGARETFELLRRVVPEDLRANQRLGTIYQRLAFAEPLGRREDLLARSDQAIQRALSAAVTLGDRAEALALLASNAKSRWIADFQAAPPEQRRSAALRSPYLPAMIDLYLKAVGADLNAHYPGVNALAMLQTQIALARQLPEVWEQQLREGESHDGSLSDREMLVARLSGSLALVLEQDAVLGKRDVPHDPWAAASRADLLLLSAPTRPQRVEQAYRVALQGADLFTLEATRRNLGIFKDLGLYESGLSAAIAVVDEAILASGPRVGQPDHVILFTGHMVDAIDRAKESARFPRTQKAEETARGLIEGAVRGVLQESEGPVLGIAGGASGGDILFHEVCASLGIRTQVLLALPRDEFQAASVQSAGATWVKRYQSLYSRLEPRVLQEGEALPGWLTGRPGYDVWQRNNLWLLFSSLSMDARSMTLVALYNPDKDPDGPGGTKHLVDEAKGRGCDVVELDARALLAE